MKDHLKTCSRCKKQLPSSDFNKNSYKPDGLQIYCRWCVAEHSKSYYQNRKKHMRDALNKSSRKRRVKWKALIEEIKSDNPCQICGESSPCCIDFHHLNPVEKEFSVGRSAGMSFAGVIGEVKKCAALCSNCHRKLHAGALGDVELRACDVTGSVSSFYLERRRSSRREPTNWGRRSG